MSTRIRCYTRTGDDGSSSLYNGERRSKEDRTFHALGDVDELNSTIGVARQFLQDSAAPGLDILDEQLVEVQSRLLDVGSAVATPLSGSSKFKVTRAQFDEAHVTSLEGWIDKMDDELPVLTNFILPSGGKAASFLHVARTICRRAERSCLPLTKGSDEEGPQTDAVVARYLNRLSDYLFTAARFAAMKEGKEETVYRKA